METERISPTVHQRSVAMELVQLRERANKKRRESAARLKCNETKIGHLETGRNRPSFEDLRALTDFYERPDRFEVLWERTRYGTMRSWWNERGNPDLDGPADFGMYVGLEQGAQALAFWDPLGLNGLLHTRRFADASIRGSDLDLVLAAKAATTLTGTKQAGALAELDEQVGERIDIRMRRQEILRHADVHFLIGEMSLRAVVGGPEIMREQLTHVIEVLEHLPNVTAQVLLGTAGAHVGQLGPFTVMDFPPDPEVDDPGAVYLEDNRQGRWYEQKDQIDTYRSIFGELVDKAAPADQTVDLLHRFYKELT